MNNRQQKKQFQGLPIRKRFKRPRKRLVHRLKVTAFAGYIFRNMRMAIDDSVWTGKGSKRNIKTAFRYKVQYNNFDLIVKYAEDACNYDFDWFEFLGGVDKE